MTDDIIQLTSKDAIIIGLQVLIASKLQSVWVGKTHGGPFDPLLPPWTFQ